MGKLFKNKLLKTKLENYQIPEFEDKLNVLNNWNKALKNRSLLAKTETQCEQAFNQDFFIRILGYTPFPGDEYTIEPKSSTETSAQKPDATLGIFTKDSKRVFAVCEIKDANTPLTRIQRRKENLSPVKQGFGYKIQYKNCQFVIVTNFAEIRIYKDTLLDYEIFTLEGLANPQNDYFEFKKFHYLLSSQNFISKRGRSKTEHLLSEIVVEQEQITKAFYEEYRDLRLQLIQNIHKNNPEFGLHLTIEKSQKLIDRIVFVCFCEDYDLLPDNQLKIVIDYAKKACYERKIWSVLRDFFAVIDTGSQKLGIPEGYNGELFKKDPQLDQLIIDDALCEKFLNISRYDFSEDLSVNILGHIFEQSITDLEDLRREHDIEGIQSVSKRKQDGIFYTPDHIVSYIVDNCVGLYLREKEDELMQEYKLKEKILDSTYDKRAVEAYEKYQEVLRNIKVIDPSCGSGAFLVKVFEYLMAENVRVAETLTDLRKGKMSIFDSTAYIKDILQNNIYGVDLNYESVEITKLSLWLVTAHKGKKLTVLKNNIKCGNSLINDSELVGIKSFDWHQEFNGILNDGGFDCVVGNPPYEVLSEKETGLTNAKEMIEYFKKHPVLSNSIQGKTNLYKVFICKALSLVKKNGYFSFIVPMALLGDLQTVPVRRYLFGNSTFQFVDCFPQKDSVQNRVFEEAKIATVIFCIKKESTDDSFPIRVHPRKYIETPDEEALFVKKKDIESYDSENLIIPNCNNEDWDIVKKIIGRRYFVRLGEYATQFQGEVNETVEGAKNALIEDKSCPQILRGANITLYSVREASQGKNLFLDDILFLEGKNKKSKAYHHLEKRIGFQRSSPQNNFRRIITAPIKPGLYCFDTVSYVTESSSQIDLDVLLLLLNSALYDWYFRVSSTNSKVNEYQFNNLPFFKTKQMASPHNLNQLLTENRYSEIIILIKEHMANPKAPPSWILEVLKDMSLKIQEVESNRVLSSRRERSSLDKKSDPIQRYANILICYLFGLSKDDYSYISERLQIML